MAAISNTSAAVKYPWDPATPLTARSTCSIFLPPSLELLPVGPTSNSSSSTTTTVATPLTARSTCSIFEFKTPSSTEWMWAKCSLGVGSVVPRVVVPSNPRSSSGRQGPKNKEPQNPLPAAASRQVLARRMKAILARRVNSVAPAASSSSGLPAVRRASGEGLRRIHPFELLGIYDL
ncbi:hypothetical protein CISG_02115 [Coccidioides immitis RMSCC 3703]|uniref:Uncharacterized protein n=2 Tax=Coccidioides immitis TaxID=5501 RepID=A0A0J8U0E1_COCIT|nr:hypothetical protein CIRG_07698 [Coccidioides immitis RMSCC 2394]KMU79697.1 hypothetical protein CISG_02115 [Coccidioides immitis RMSCC 3703]